MHTPWHAWTTVSFCLAAKATQVSLLFQVCNRLYGSQALVIACEISRGVLSGLVADLWTLRGSSTEVEEGAVAWIALDLPGAVPAPRKGAAVAGAPLLMIGLCPANNSTDEGGMHTLHPCSHIPHTTMSCQEFVLHVCLLV